MTSASMRLTGVRKLNTVKTLAGHEPHFEDGPGGPAEVMFGTAIAYFTDGQKMISGFGKTARIWDLKTGEEMEKARVVCEQLVSVVAVSRDGRWVVVAGGKGKGQLKVCEMNTGVIKSFQGRSSHITTIDISRDSKLLVSGSYGTTQIWDLEIGNFAASTSTSPDRVCAVRFSQDSKKLVVVSENNFEVWNIKARKLESKVRKNYIHYTNQIRVHPFWTTNDRTIVAALSLDSHPLGVPTTVCELDSSTLETVGAPFQGHADSIHSLDLSFDCALLVSASIDNTVKLWAFQSRHLIASFDVHHIGRLVLSPNARQLAYTIYKPGQHRIYICDIPPDILAELWPDRVALGSNVRENGDPLNSDAAARRSAPAQHILAPVPVVAQPLGRSPTTHQQDFFILRYFRKLVSRKDEIPAIAGKPYDPLDYPATSSSVPTTNLIDHNSGENSGHMLPISQSANRASSSMSHLLHLSNRWAARTDALPPIIDVPLTQGQKRNAAAGAPRRDDRYIRDEEFDSRPTSPNSASQHTPSGEHRGRRLCFCL